jgi:hypothetical protein
MAEAFEDLRLDPQGAFRQLDDVHVLVQVRASGHGGESGIPVDVLFWMLGTGAVLLERMEFFATEEEALAAANGTEYGLVAYAFTRDLERALRVADRLQVGMVGLNQGIVSNPAAPFGGVKHSGLGREGGVEGIAEFLETKYVAIRS